MTVKHDRISRRRFLAITGAFSVAGLVSACGGPAATTAPAANKEKEEAKPAEPTTAPKPAEMVTLRYVYTNFNGVSADQQIVTDALSKLTMERINAKMDIMNLDFGSFNDKVTLMSAGGEQYDLVYTANWTNDYYKNVDNGQFEDLTDLIPNLAPGLWKSLPVATWGAAKIKGKLYAAINQQQFPKNAGFYVKKEIADKYKMDVNAINKWEDLEPFLEKIKADEKIAPFVSSIGLRQNEICGYGPVDDAIGFIWVKGDDKAGTLNNFYEVQRYKEVWDLERRWWEKGYIPKEDPKEDAQSALLKANKAFFKCEPVVKPKFEAEMIARTGWDLYLRALAPNILTTSGITATLTGVSRTTVSKEVATKWLELVNTDKPTFNLLCFGIEGKHWNWKIKDKEVLEQIKDSAYNPTTDWMWGNQYAAYYRNESQIGAWEAGKAINDSASPLATLGFVMNREPVKNEIAAVNSLTTIVTPTGPKGIPASELGKVVADMNGAGAKKVMDEMATQIAEWMKTK